VLQPPDKVQLCKGSSPLEDAKRLSDLKIENDDIIGMCFVQPGGARRSRTTRTLHSSQQSPGS
jgi:hypothetical protein